MHLLGGSVRGAAERSSIVVPCKKALFWGFAQERRNRESARPQKRACLQGNVVGQHLLDGNVGKAAERSNIASQHLLDGDVNAMLHEAIFLATYLATMTTEKHCKLQWGCHTCAIFFRNLQRPRWKLFTTLSPPA